MQLNKRKVFTFLIIGLFIGAVIVPNIYGKDTMDAGGGSERSIITLLDEGFETWPPAGWTNTGWLDSHYGSAYNGSHWAYSWATGDTLTTPTLSFEEDTELSFWYAAENVAHPMNLEVKVDDTDSVWSVTGNINTAYQQATVDLSGYSGDHTISFVGQTSDFYGQMLDDITVTTELLNQPPMSSNEAPEDGDTDVSVSLSKLSVYIYDLENDSFDWSIETDPDVGKNSSSGESNGTKNCVISSLNYDTMYTWYVNATDPSGSGVYTREVYTFTTESKGGGSGGEQPPPTNDLPVADASASQTSGFIGASIAFDGSLSTDSDGTITNYTWDFDDGTTGNGETTTHIYTNNGTYHVTLTVTDSDGATDEDTVDIIITKANTPPKKPMIEGPTVGYKNTSYEYIAVSTDADNDTIQYTFNWGDSSNDTTTNFLPNGTAATQMHSWTEFGIYIVTVFAEDKHYAKSETEKVIVLVDVDVVFIDDEIKGYLIDYNRNGIFAVFHNNATGVETFVEQQSDGLYLIDSNGDDKWDYTFGEDVGLQTYQNQKEIEEPETPGFELLFLLCALLIHFILRKQMNKP